MDNFTNDLIGKLQINKEISFIEMKYNFIKDFIENTGKLSREIIEQLQRLRKTCVDTCDNEKYLYTIAVERDFKQSQIRAIDELYNAETIEQMFDISNAFTKSWVKYVMNNQYPVNVNTGSNMCQCTPQVN